MIVGALAILVAEAGTGPAGAQDSSTSATVAPSSGPPGTAVAIDGSVGCCSEDEYSVPLYWTATNEEIGAITVTPDGTVTGDAMIPVDAPGGTGYVSTCGPGTHDGCLLTVAFEVAAPNLVAEPSEVRPGDGFEVSGEGWCCDGDAGAVIDLSTGQEWGTATVDAAGVLSAGLVVPADASAGDTELDVCIDALCATAAITVLDPVTSPSAPPPGGGQGGGGGSGSPGQTSGSVAGSSGGGAGVDPGVFVDAEPVGDDGRPAAALSGLVGLALAVLAVVLVVGRRWRRVPAGAPLPLPDNATARVGAMARVLARPDAGTHTIEGRGHPVLSISVVIDPGAGVTTLEEEQR